MYNYDRTFNETGYNGEVQHSEFEFEWENNTNEYQGEFETYGETQGENYGEYSGELSNETQEMELATELLGVQNEAQLEQFLGGLIRKVAGGVKTFANSAAGKAIGGILRQAAKRALPIAGGALGSFVGGPVGGMLGRKLGAAASGLFELELEGLSNEDREFEVARAYVRFASDAVRRAASNSRAYRNPNQVARLAVYNAARRWAPGFIKNNNYGVYNANTSSDANSGGGYEQSGTWYRQGNQIIVNV